MMNVSAIIVTRGDHDLGEILDSFPEEWEVIVWNNGLGRAFLYVPPWGEQEVLPGGDLSVYGRYAAIEHASHDLIYVQDDDCVVSNPQAIVDAWHANRGYEGARAFVDHVVCNMPREFRHDFYVGHALVGFGAVFQRDAPQRAFRRYEDATRDAYVEGDPLFQRTCDVVFTGLTPRVLVDVPKSDLPWAHDDDRMWKQPTHQAERARMLELVKDVT